MKLSRILLVDHDGGDLERITESIINLNMGPTVVARNEVEAIEDVNNRDPELVIMNICESGAARSVNLANKIKSNHQKPILYLAPKSEINLLQSANLLNQSNCLIKPFTGTDLRYAVEKSFLSLENNKVKIQSEKDFLNALKCMPDGLISTDIVGNVTYMNPAAESLTGWKLSEAKRMVLQDVFSVNNGLGDEVPIQFSNHKVGNSVQNIFLSNKKGLRLPIQNSSTPLRDQDGSLVGIVVVFRHLNSTNDDSLVQDEEKIDSIRKIVNGLVDPLLLVDQSWRVTFANDSAINFFDFDIGFLNNYNFLESNCPFFSNESIASAKIAMENREGFRFDVFHDDKDLWHELIGHPYGDGMLIQLTDITQRVKQSESALRTERLESLGLMARGFAHDFNNLLTVILGNLSLAKIKIPNAAEGYDEVESALSGTIRAQNRIQQLLTFAKGGAPIKQSLDLSGIVHEISNDIQRNELINYDFDLPDDLWRVEVDPGQIKRVIENLIRNAEEAMTGGGELLVKLRNYGPNSNYSQKLPASLVYDYSTNYLLIEISDNGHGIKENKLDKIFEPYFTTKSDANATGIGLTVCSSIIEAHQGSIGVQSAPGFGTSIYIVLPVLSSVHQRSDHKALTPELLSASSILILEDDSLIRQLLVANLINEGYSVSETEEGSETVSTYHERFKSGKPFDLIIMDLSIPNGMGGVDAIKEIRKINPDVKAIVSSGYSDDPVMSNPKEYGFDAVLPKPYKPQELNSLVKKLLK